MKKSTLLVATGILLLAAAALLPDPCTKAGSGTSQAGKTTKASHRSSASSRAHSPSSKRPAEGNETANLSAWRQRFDALLAETDNREDAIGQVLQEIDGLYHTWVSGELAPVIDRPPGDRYDELADIEHSVNEGTAAILDQLGIEESQRLEIASAAEALAAEGQYAEAANDSAKRLALLRLDREQLSRRQQVLAVPDDAARTQAIAELDAWYEAGVNEIFATPAAPDQDL
jgi:hypothetical protein